MPWQATDTQWPSSCWWAPIRRPHPSSHRKGNTKRAGSWDPKGAEICITYVSIVSCFAHLTYVSNIYKNTDIVLFGSVAYLAVASKDIMFQGQSPIYFAISSGIFTQLQVSTRISLPNSLKNLEKPCFCPPAPRAPLAREAVLRAFNRVASATMTAVWCGCWPLSHKKISLAWNWDSLGTGGNQKDWNHWNILYGYRMLSQF